jgi:hypothetical protein
LDPSHARLDIPAAAVQLGLSEAAVRKRVQRRQLASVRVDGHVYVLLDAAGGPSQDTASQARPPRPWSNGPSQAGPLVVHLEAQIAQARDEAAFLRAECERLNAIILRLVEPRPALAAGAPLSATQGGPPRPWWRRWLDRLQAAQ